MFLRLHGFEERLRGLLRFLGGGADPAVRRELGRGEISAARMAVGMSYYEELGIATSASAEEIRQAYKEMVRLLHPDRCQDEGLRRAAERQMKRLNAMVAVLSDPVARRRYDLSLAGGPLEWLAAGRVLARSWCAAQPAFLWAAEATRRSWVWLVTAGIAVAGLAYYFAGQEGTGGLAQAQVARTGQAGIRGREAAHRVAIPAEDKPARRASSAARQRERRVETETGTALESRGGAPSLHAEPAEPILSSTIVVPGRVPSDAARAVQMEPEVKSQVSPAVPAGSPPLAVFTPPLARHEAAAVASGLEGTWLFVPPRVPERQAPLYPPEYIELKITEESSLLFGRYRARYRVIDRMLWPEVSFEFEGQRAQGTYGWRGVGGGRGEVRLKSLGVDRLEVTWWASKLGEQLSLASGTAVLVREGVRPREEK